MRHRYSTRSRFALSRRWLGRGLRSWGGVVAVAVICSLLATSARAAAPPSPLWRGGLLLHADAPTPSTSSRPGRPSCPKVPAVSCGCSAGRSRRQGGRETGAGAGPPVRRRASPAARLATASYEGSPPDQALAFFAGGDPQQVLGKSATIDYLAQQRDARDQQLHRLMVAGDRARTAAQAKVAGLRQMVASLAGQQKQVKRLLDKCRPQSPTIGDSITPRMRGVRDEVDRRFGPFSAIGCYRPGSDGEHPLGRACDFMLSTGGVMPAASWIQKGYDIAAWAQANASRLGIMYIIYRQRIWDVRMPSSGWVPMENRGSITANHYDHVHISVF